jgi:hypothetical protein
MTFAAVKHLFGWRSSAVSTARPGEVHLTREQIIARVERGAQRRLGVSAQEMLSAYRRGEVPDPGLIADLLMLIRLLPDNDPLLRPSGR